MANIIFYFRYELREDRKREAVRTSGHIDNLKRDIMRSLRGAGINVPQQQHHDHNTLKTMDSISPTMPRSSSDNFLSLSEMETLKHEIVSSLRTELRDFAREIATMGGISTNPPPPPAGRDSTVTDNAVGPNYLPPNSSELYHTHLYTQL